MRKMWMHWAVAVIAVIAAAAPVVAQSELDQKIDSNIGDWVGTYQHFHANPELSTQEKATSELIAGTLRKLGYDVTDHFGKYEEADLVSYGVVAVLKNGPGPTVYVRTELDALPVRENTGLPYASKVTVKRANEVVGVMHACGHDLHMTVFLGTAKLLAEEQSHWSGTLVMIAQPAEETVAGAAAMLRAGLFEKFPKPDYVLALHDFATLPAGVVAWREGSIRCAFATDGAHDDAGTAGENAVGDHASYVRNDVVFCAGMKRSHCYHRRLQRILLPAHDRLQKHDEFRRNHNRILAGADSVDITIRGYGGHGAAPNATKVQRICAAAGTRDPRGREGDDDCGDGPAAEIADSSGAKAQSS